MSILRSLAPAFVKKIVWDRKYQNVAINPDIAPSDLLRHLASIDKNASVLDLGCGPGNLLAALRRKGWEGHFVGVDVSQQAIETGRKAGDPNAEWHVSTIEDFRPYSYFDVISLCESIYYVKPSRLEEATSRCLRALSPNGMMYVRIAHEDRHQPYVEHVKALAPEIDPPLFIIRRK